MEPSIPATVQFGNSPTYKIGTKLGEGGYGQVFLGQRVTDASNSIMHGPEEVAIKFEKAYRKGKKRPPPLEWGAYDQLGGCEGIPRIYFKGHCGPFYVMIMDLLGPSLCKICSSQGPLMLHSDVNSIATQAISILETLHNKGFVHCDIKPENILFGRAGSANEKKLYIADLGSADLQVSRSNHSMEMDGFEISVQGVLNDVARQAYGGAEIEWSHTRANEGNSTLFKRKLSCGNEAKSSGRLGVPSVYANLSYQALSPLETI